MMYHWKNTVLWSGTVVRERHIGTDCIIHPNAVIEQMDLDFAPALKESLVKIPQIEM
jgi:UDP-3-O-[3-hydroxymyristoyl] glucosamine N-acyltransferase